jgi:cellulose synthase/poly-beta-1,6-N-acetylglucosamine synthase-like glycosyltransferase
VTEYRNLLHHFVHQTGPREATTFWAGCGAVRRSAYLAVGGFDESYAQPSIEDIELGMRLRAAGERILLCPEIQVKHLKRWTFREMVRVDVTKRAIPWTRLLMDRPGTGSDLNLEPSQKLCVVFVFLAMLACAAGLVLAAPRGLAFWAWGPALCLLPVLWINRGLYALFFRHKGAAFGLASILLHLFYYVYSGFAFLWTHLTHRRSPRSDPSAA